MKLKYYLRGLGIGIIVTAVLMGIAGGGRESLSNEQIRERAAQLGMVDSNSLTLAGVQAQKDAEKGSDTDVKKAMDGNVKDAQENVTGDVQEAGNDDAQENMTEDVQESAAGDAQEAGNDDVQENAAGDVQEAGNDDVQENMTEDAQESTAGDAQTISFTVRSGDNSDSVSRRLAEAGLVADARSYDRYLCDNGYSRVIRAGTYEIALGADEQEITKIITGKK